MTNKLLLLFGLFLFPLLEVEVALCSAPQKIQNTQNLHEKNSHFNAVTKYLQPQKKTPKTDGMGRGKITFVLFVVFSREKSDFLE